MIDISKLTDINDSNLPEILSHIDSTNELSRLNSIRVSLFGRNGILPKMFKSLKNTQGDKKQIASSLNNIKEKIAKTLDTQETILQDKAINDQLKKDTIDASLCQPIQLKAAKHPILSTLDDILDYFNHLGFSIEDGPLIEDDFHNFEALNIPFYHPARDMQDTFYFHDNKLLRTHTSPVQIRTMKNSKPPIRIIAPGAVFRRDYDLTHTPMFHQIEGLVVDKKNHISFAHLKYILQDFLTYIFGDVKVRFRPSFFPFTEPSSEVDISCVFCQQHEKGCRVCSHTGWLEVLGCGVVNENVFKSVSYENVSGYAFGLGVERFAMLLKKIPDLRLMYEGDLRLLEQFR